MKKKSLYVCIRSSDSSSLVMAAQSQLCQMILRQHLFLYMTYSSHHSFTSAAILGKRYYFEIPYQRSLSEILLKQHAISSFHLLRSTSLIKVSDERLVASVFKTTSLIDNLLSQCFLHSVSVLHTSKYIFMQLYLQINVIWSCFWFHE